MKLDPDEIAAIADAVAERLAPDELLPLDACGLERRTALQLVADGKLPCTKLGRKRYVRRSAVLALVPSTVAQPEPQPESDVDAELAQWGARNREESEPMTPEVTYERDTAHPRERCAICGGELGDALAAHEPAQAPPALLDGHALARELGVSERQVRRLRAEGMPAVRIVESYRYELAAVIAWLRARGAGQ